MPGSKTIKPSEAQIKPQAVNETRRLQLSFLLPLMLAISAIIAALAISSYLHHKHDIEEGVIQLRTSAARLYHESAKQHMHALHTLMDVLERDEPLHDALARKDRQALMQRATPLFESLKRNYGITHLYFSGPDRANLLRAHQLQHYGDVIERTTTLEASRSGTMASGIELGMFGQLTLRLVSPWHEARTQRLIGYVELGMEIDKVLENIHNLFGLDVYVFVKKEFLQRNAWEDGMRMLGRTPDWDGFPDAVLNTQAPHELPVVLSRQLAQAGFSSKPSSTSMVCNGKPCQALMLPLTDISGRNVAQMVLLADTSQQETDAQQSILAGGVASVATGIVLFIFFYWLTGRIGRRIERDEQMLHDLASHDGLTGLYNHRTFYSLLEDEVARAGRYNHPLSLLMLDIDHFKRVNDTYGHVAGDCILSGLAQLLQQAVRHEDKVCRYGGEEIAVILPVTDLQTAVLMAERLRMTVEEYAFKSDSSQEISITVSVGVASLTEQTATAAELVNEADAALYSAKERGRNHVCSRSQLLTLTHASR
ncbi:MAG: diguanylate cyclase [Gallionellaceae bacterium]|nr:diguanylate cyclase [Gallionellaceae bacterium]